MEEKRPAAANGTVRILIVVLVCLIAVTGVLAMQLMRRPADQPDSGADASLRIGYAEGTVAMDEASLQSAIDDMYRKTAEGRIALSYKNDAVSHDGQTFACYIRNAPSNTYDEFIGIYADAAYTDQLFLSELIKPGTGFEKLTLDKTLETGKHTVYVVYTQVKEQDGEQVMVGQTAVTMNFIVKD